MELELEQVWNAQKSDIRLTETMLAYKNLVKQTLLDTIPENRD